MSRPNVVWVTLDSVRQDRTTMGGHHRDTTPNLQRIADSPRGNAFAQCISHGIWTLPSSASILTGTYPSHNTVGIDGSTLPDTLPTVAELFSEAGYRTACLSRNGHLSEATGMHRGFDRFEWLAASTLLRAAGPVTVAKYLLNIRRHSAGLTTDTAKHATPFVMNDIGKRWLRDLDAREEPYFAYFHYNEPHRPFVPPLPWVDRFTDGLEVSGRDAVGIAMDVHHSLYERIADDCRLTDRERDALFAMYDAEIAYTDHCIGRLYDYVQGLDGETVFVVTADHGELFGEHGVLAHKLVLDDGLVNVPLVTHGLGDLAIGSDDVVQHGDLMRTLLEDVDARTDSLQGVNLREGGRGFAISQRAPEDFAAFTRHDPEFDTSRYHASLVTGLRTTAYKLLKSDDRTELFELPDEETDVRDAHPDVTADLETKLDDWLATDGQPVAEARDAAFSDAMKRQLADLGYVE